jgi:hypothetical protein
MDILVFVGVISLGSAGVLLHKGVLTCIIVFYIPSIVGFIALVIIDTVLTRKLYYFAIALKFLFFVLCALIFTIHVDNRILGSKICSALLNTEIKPNLIMNMIDT